MKKVYVLTRKVNVTHGHGDYGTEIVLATKGSYGEGGFHPVFTDKERATNYVNLLKEESDIQITELSEPTCHATFIAHDYCGWENSLGRFTAMPNGETLTCQSWMGQNNWDEAQLKWFEQFPENLFVYRCLTGPYYENENKMGTVGEIKKRLHKKVTKYKS